MFPTMVFQDPWYFSLLEIARRDVAGKIAKASDAKHVCPSYSASNMVIDAAGTATCYQPPKQMDIDSEEQHELATNHMYGNRVEFNSTRRATNGTFSFNNINLMSEDENKNDNAATQIKRRTPVASEGSLLLI